MTTKLELERLLRACEECADHDDHSYDAHFNACSQCQEYAAEAEKVNKQLQFLEVLAAKPLDSRKQLLGARIRTFLSMPPAERKSAISDLLDGLSDISEQARYKVVKARTDLMMEIPKEFRQNLMGALGEIMSQWPPERKQLEQQAVMKATEDYFFLKRMMVRKKFAALMN